MQRAKTPEEIHDTLMSDFETEKILRVLSSSEYSILDIPKKVKEEAGRVIRHYSFTDYEGLRKIIINQPETHRRTSKEVLSQNVAVNYK